MVGLRVEREEIVEAGPGGGVVVVVVGEGGGGGEMTSGCAVVGAPPQTSETERLTERMWA